MFLIFIDPLLLVTPFYYCRHKTVDPPVWHYVQMAPLKYLLQFRLIPIEGPYMHWRNVVWVGGWIVNGWHLSTSSNGFHWNEVSLWINYKTQFSNIVDTFFSNSNSTLNHSCYYWEADLAYKCFFNEKYFLEQIRLFAQTIPTFLAKNRWMAHDFNTLPICITVLFSVVTVA